MRSKMRIEIVAMMLVMALTSACSISGPNADEGIIGEKLEAISPIVGRDGVERKHVALFDKTTQRILQFNLENMTYERHLAVVNPQEKHTLLFHEAGNYIIDLTDKHLAIFNSQGVSNDQPIQFMGKPLSAAFRPDLGLLVIYDDLASVGMLKLDVNGNVIDTWLDGSLVTGNASISSGDITSNGKLVLALSDNSIAVVDLEQTIAQKRWVMTKFSTSLSQIVWVAPVSDDPDQIFVKAKSKLALIRLSAQTVISEAALSSDVALKYSKSIDPHVVFGNSMEATKVAYVSDCQIQMKTVSAKINTLYVSRLDLAKDTWTLVDSKVDSYYSVNRNDLEYISKDRRILRFRFSSLLAMQKKHLPDEAQLELMENNVFALFPSELGYAVRYGIMDDSKAELKLFNVDHLK